MKAMINNSTETIGDILVGEIDATPDKKILQSIASDIDLKKGVLELVDNAIDEWKLRENPSLTVKLTFDVSNKLLIYSDNAGGIKEENLNMIIQPGGTTRKPDEVSIGEFGIGSKRAIVALSAQADVVSRFESRDTFKIVVDDSWTSSDSWKIPKYKTAPASPGSTQISFKRTKFDLTLEILQEIKRLLSETYCFALSKRFILMVNGEPIKPSIFDKWSFPPHGRYPRTYKTFISVDGRRVNVEITVGLMLKSSQTGEYGFDIFCNDRMILKNYRHPEIGFTTKILGYPHAAIAWFKGVVRISGANRDMPWNSTKSGLDFSNPIVQSLKDKLVKLSSPYVQLSRRLGGDSPRQIAAYPSGRIKKVDLTSQEELVLSKEDLPDLPPGRRSQADVLLNRNRAQIRKFPWTRALVENIFVADLILKKVKLENKNRFALILLDSCLEVAFRDYLFRVKRLKYSREDRTKLIERKNLYSAMKSNSDFPDEIWNSIEFFYELRNSLYHEVAYPEITTSDIERFRNLAGNVLLSLHGLVTDTK
jgi:hypothetical protein